MGIITESTPEYNLNDLEQFGFTFTLIYAKSKAPIGENWQNRPHSAAEADRHVAQGGNAGNLAGTRSNNHVWIDADLDCPLFLQCNPQLQNSLIVWRDDAPDRGKVAIRITDTLPRSTSWNPAQATSAKKQAGCKVSPLAELLSTGRNVAIIGTHPDGAQYRNNGQPPIELTFAELDAIWYAWTGEHPQPEDEQPQAIEHPQRTPQPTNGKPSPIETVKAHWPSTYHVFAHHGRITEQPTRAKNGDLKLGGNGGLFVGDPNSTELRTTLKGNTIPAREVWYCHSISMGGDQLDAWYYCETGQKLDHTDKEAVKRTIQAMADTAGIAIEWGRSDEIAHTLHNARAYVDHMRATGQIGPSETRAALAAIDIYEREGDTTAPISIRDIGGRCGKSARAAMKLREKLERWLIVRVARGNGVLSDIYALSKAARMDMHKKYTQQGYSPGGGAVAPLCLPFVHIDMIDRYKDDDAFLINMAPAKIRERINRLNKKIEARVLAAETIEAMGDIVSFVDEIERQKAAIRAECSAKYQSAWGDSGLAVVQALYMAERALSITELADATYLHRNTVRGAVGRMSTEMLEKGLSPILSVEQVGREKRVSLADDWREQVDGARRHMGTLGTTARRRIAAARDRIERGQKYAEILETRKRQGILSDEQAEKLTATYRIVEDAEREIKAIRETGQADAEPQVVPMPLGRKKELASVTKPMTQPQPVERPTRLQAVKGERFNDFIRIMRHAWESADRVTQTAARRVDLFIRGELNDRREFYKDLSDISPSLTYMVDWPRLEAYA